MSHQTDIHPSRDEFLAKFELLISHLWRLYDRLRELKEFEKQWSNLFEMLRQRTGCECAINIMQPSIYQSFHWDKYHVLANDLVSLINNELKDENPDGVIKQCFNHLSILSEQQYFDAHETIKLEDLSDLQISESEKRKRVVEDRWEHARDLRTKSIEALGRLFPKISEPYKIESGDRGQLIKQLRALNKKLESIRTFFAHKHETGVTAKYRSSTEQLNVKLLEETLDGVFGIARDIGFVLTQSTYTKGYLGFESQVQDLIDIILFGSINSMMMRYYEDRSSSEYYWQARQAFWDTEKILQIVASKAPLEKL